jgi:hypothetical protein
MMPLQYTGVKVRLQDCWAYQARSPDGGTVAVQISEEALNDYGEARALDKGREKYDLGKARAGTTVTVQGADFE